MRTQTPHKVDPVPQFPITTMENLVPREVYDVDESGYRQRLGHRKENALRPRTTDRNTPVETTEMPRTHINRAAPSLHVECQGDRVRNRSAAQCNCDITLTSGGAGIPCAATAGSKRRHTEK